MVILSMDSKNFCHASYWSTSYPEKPEWFRNPKLYSDQYRHISDFTRWDGHPKARTLNEDTTNIMTQYCASHDKTIRGTFQGRTSDGKLILETASGHIITMHPNVAEEVIPFTFEAKSANSSYRCHYTLSNPRSMVNVDDVLMSKSGNIYTVTAVDTKSRSPKGEFKGSRLVREEI